jgi:hypothetical protein
MKEGIYTGLHITEGNSNKLLVSVLPKYLLYFQYPLISMEHL